MMALQILLLLEVIVILFSPSSSYPTFGTKRYGRSLQRVSSWPPYQMVRSQRYPVNYYELYPSSTYPEEYDSYPLYYPPARTSKYEVYQAVLPYYYRPGNYYDNYPVDEMIQEAEREEREDAQPIGHELLYENEDMRDAEDNLDEVNAAFLQNLIMSQMYKDSYKSANRGGDPRRDYYDDDDVDDDDDSGYGYEEYAKSKNYNRHQEDEDVRELKQLAKPTGGDGYWFHGSNFRKQKEAESKNHFEKRKPVVKQSTSTEIPPAPEPSPKRDSRGQKEEVLMRPATPVRRPFAGPVLDAMSKKKQPSVYDTIKHMLDMEKNLEKKYGDEIRPAMKKRIYTSEESLAQQLSVLKKSQ